MLKKMEESMNSVLTNGMRNEEEAIKS